MTAIEKPCQVQGCTRRAEDTIWPDNGEPVHVCISHAHKNELTLDDGNVLVWSDWSGWEIMPEKWEPKP